MVCERIRVDVAQHEWSRISPDLHVTISIGVADITGEQPHDGEMHPDGDELLYLISGAATVTSQTSCEPPEPP